MPIPVPTLFPADVHIWRVDLDAGAQRLASARSVLSEEERERADRFYFEDGRRRFAVGRAALRRLLGAYLETDPAGLAFAYSAKGKPSLAFPDADISFNVSHAEGIAVYGFTRGRRVGVDVERLKPDIEADKLIERFFSTAEREMFRRLPAEIKIAAFFRGWVCKEALLKAWGTGLDSPLHLFDVELEPGRPPQLLGTRPDPFEARRWMLQLLDIAPGYASAVAIESNGEPIQVREVKDFALADL